MTDVIFDPVLPISLITLVSLLVNAVTIYRWISESKDKSRLNDQAYYMVMGLALANTKRSNMIVKRISILEQQGKNNDEAMIYLENMYSDAKSNIESLLAAAKALRPDKADQLPFDGDSLLNHSRLENTNLSIRVSELEQKTRQKA